jgi:hypothetical protein
VSAILRYPALLFAFGVAQLRRLPGARLLSPLTRWLPILLFLGALVVLFLWGSEASPQRMRLADLVAGRLSPMQSWIIVTGDLAALPTSRTDIHLYRLTDPDAPNASLEVRSHVVQPLGRTTVSGHILGGRDGVPVGSLWSAPLDADEVLATELPPPWTSIALVGLGLLVIAARRSRYPMFVSERPSAIPAWVGAARVPVPDESAPLGSAPVAGGLAFTSDEPGAADLSMAGSRPIPVRLHSVFTTVDVGVLYRVTGSNPGLRVRSRLDDFTLLFASRRERDAAFHALSAEAERQRRSRGLDAATPSQLSA